VSSYTQFNGIPLEFGLSFFLKRLACAPALHAAGSCWNAVLERSLYGTCACCKLAFQMCCEDRLHTTDNNLHIV
jgi:hypothetical protein